MKQARPNINIPVYNHACSWSCVKEEIGRVTGTIALHTSDPVLRSAWEEGERMIARSSPEAEELTRFSSKERGITSSQKTG
jgi:hypothetical protein